MVPVLVVEQALGTQALGVAPHRQVPVVPVPVVVEQALGTQALGVVPHRQAQEAGLRR